MSNWPPLLNVGERTWDSKGSICRPSDKFNEQRAITILVSRFPSMRQYEYVPDPHPFGPIDGQWRSESGSKLVAFSEIKSHAGRTMGSTTILNLRKWDVMDLLQQSTSVPVLFIAQYENAVAFQNMKELGRITSTFTSQFITDTKSAHRITSTEEVWKIPTDKMRIIKPEDAVIPDQSLAELNEWAHKIQMENAQ